MYWTNILFLFLGWQFVGLQLQAQELLTLGEAQRIALDQHLGILIARDQLNIAALNNAPGEAGMLPRVAWLGSGNSSMNNTRQQFFTGEERAENNALTLGLQTSVEAGWTVFDGKAMFYRKDRLGLLEHMNRLELQNRSYEVLSEVTLSYFEVVQQYKAIAVLENAITLTREFYDLAQMRLQIGTGTELEVLQLRNEIKADSVRLNLEYNRLQQFKIHLNRSMQLSPDTDFTIDTGMAVNDGLMYAELLDRATHANFELLLARQDLLITEKDMAIARADRYPTLDVNGGYAFTYSTSQVGIFQSNRSYGPFLGVTARMNLFDGNRVQRNISRAQIHNEMAQRRLDDIRLNIETAIYSNYEHYRAYLQQIKLEGESREVARQNLDLAEQMFRLGRVSNIEVREARRALLNAESRILTAELLAKEAELRLLFLSGMLSPEE